MFFCLLLIFFSSIDMNVLNIVDQWQFFWIFDVWNVSFGMNKFVDKNVEYRKCQYINKGILNWVGENVFEEDLSCFWIEYG